MLKAVEDLSPPRAINTAEMDQERQLYIADADTVGSVPPALLNAYDEPVSATNAQGLSVLLDKLGERMAFERTGTRLYTALIGKYLGSIAAGNDPLVPLSLDVIGGSEQADATQEIPSATLHRIRADELGHFHLLSDCIAELGGDPTAQTPCADVSSASSIGIMQVLTDPRTTLAQSLNAMLMVELTDTAGWGLLAQLAADLDESAMAKTFLDALETEQEHLEIIRGWLLELLRAEAGTTSV